MADGTFTVATADWAKAEIFPALIKTIEIQKGGEASDQWQTVGRINAGVLKLDAVIQNSAGGVPSQVGYKLSLSAEILATGTNMRTALNLILANFAQARITDVNGHTYTFAGTSTTANGEMDLTVGDSIEGDAEGSRKIMLTGAGFITAARYTALYAEA